MQSEKFRQCFVCSQSVNEAFKTPASTSSTSQLAILTHPEPNALTEITKAKLNNDYKSE